MKKNKFCKIMTLILGGMLVFTFMGCSSDSDSEGSIHTITFSIDGIAGEFQPIDVVHGKAMPDLSFMYQPQKNGYFFAGFFDAVEDGTMYYEYDLTSARTWNKKEDATLYAQWVFMPMARIPAGSFMMGSPANEWGRNGDIEGPQHLVTLTSGFYMGRYPVTQEQYLAVMGTNPSYFSVFPNFGNKCPVEMVSWLDALEFCNRLSMIEGLTSAYSINGSANPDHWGRPDFEDDDFDPTDPSLPWNNVQIISGSVGYRLPTEAQWEYACRAGTTTAYNTGAIITNNTGWHDANSNGTTRIVGSHLLTANAWGLHDMHGNISEMCWDWDLPGYGDGTARTDPLGPAAPSLDWDFGRIIRGGSWDDTASQLRSASRNSSSPFNVNEAKGFRVIRPL